MLIAKGVIAHAVLPLALAVTGGGLLATASDLQHKATTRYASTRAEVRHALRLDWQPEPLAPRSSGEIALWQRRDNSVRESEVTTDYQGNIYVQDAASGKLRMLKLQPGFRLNRQRGDWAAARLAIDTRPVYNMP